MYCNQCGAEVKEGARFCTKCGAELDNPYSSVSDQNPSVSETPYTADQSQTVSEKKTVGKGLKRWLAISVLLCILFGYGLYSVMNMDSKPEHVASRYFISLINNDAEGAFNCLGINRTEWLNPETFVSYVRDVKEKDENLGRIRTMSAEKQMTGNSSVQYQMNYTYGDAKSRGSYYVEVADENGKWKIPADNKVIQNAPLSFPKGSKVKINGIELSEKYLDASQDNALQDLYTIPEMFYGTYEIQVDLDGYEPYTGKAMMSSQGLYLSTDSMQISKETAEELEKQAGADLQALYEAVIAQDDFDEVAGLFTDRALLKQGIVSDYERQVSEFKSKSPLVSLKMDSMEAKGSTSSSEVYLEGRYQADYVYTTYSGNTRNETSNGNKSVTMRYVRDGDEWKLSEMPNLNIYY